MYLIERELSPMQDIVVSAPDYRVLVKAFDEAVCVRRCCPIYAAPRCMDKDAVGFWS